ncbi:GrpB family protein [Candidatus Saccharibacteria bacterium]|nr:GrpB family protein [Candidatus Saccharibacteria bacterium]
MSVDIKEYNIELKERFNAEVKRLREILGSDVVIEHVGSSAVGIGGKNIVDILVGVGSTDRMAVVRDLLASAGYREGHDTHPDRIFMAWRKDDDGVDRETGEGDYHVHIVVKDSEECLNMLKLRDYLRAHPEEAQEYFKMKLEFAREAGYDRKKYKALKSVYVKELLERAKERKSSGK